MQGRSRLVEFWIDFKRRRLFRTGMLYAVAAWAIVQGASIAIPTFDVPIWVLRAILVIAVAGFPVAMVLSWVFDVTPSGLELTDRPDGAGPEASAPSNRWLRPLLGTAIIALIAGGTTWLWTAHLTRSQPTEFSVVHDSQVPPVVVVLPLENLTGDPRLAWTGSGIAALVRDDLARTGRLAVVSAARALRLSDDAKAGSDSIFKLAASAGITHALSGEVLRTPSGLTVATRLTDLRRNIEITSSRQQGLQLEGALSASPAIAVMVRRGLGVVTTDKVDLFATDFATRNMASYESFLAGMENFLRFRYDDARHAFQVAVDKTPDFAIARYRLAHTLAVQGDTEGALRELKVASGNSGGLSTLEREYIAAAERYFARDYPAAQDRYEAILRTHPYETEARLFLIYILNDESRLEEALANATTLATQEPDSEVAWGAIGDLNLRLKRFQDADKALQRYMTLAPENPNAHLLRGDSLFLRKRYDEARPYYERALAIDPKFGSAHLQLAYVDYFTDHWMQAAGQFETIARSNDINDSDRITAAFEWANLLRAEGRCSKATSVVESFQSRIAKEQIREALSLAFHGYCALDQGDVATARRWAAQAVDKAPGRATRYLFLQALAEIGARDFPAAQSTIREIEKEQQPSTTDDQSSRKAAQYLAGLLALAEGDVTGATSLIRRATDGPGTEYDLYQAGLAEALVAAGEYAQASGAARRAIDSRDPRDPRIELEMSRRRALLLEVKALPPTDTTTQSRELPPTLASMWAHADPEFLARMRVALNGRN